MPSLPRPSQFAIGARLVTHELRGVVISHGLMDKTVKVRVGGQKWNKVVNKFYNAPEDYLVHDPNNSVVTGDVVAIAPGWRTSKRKRHVLKQIIAPYGDSIENKPPVPTLEERIAEHEAKKAAKNERRAVRKQEAEMQAREEWRKLKEKKAEKRLAQSGGLDKLAKEDMAAQQAETGQTSLSDVD